MSTTPPTEPVVGEDLADLRDQIKATDTSERILSMISINSPWDSSGPAYMLTVLLDGEHFDGVDALLSAADALAGIALASMPTFPEGRWGDVQCGAMLQPDGSYMGDARDN